MDDNKLDFKLSPFGSAALTALFSTITNSEVRALFRAGEILNGLGTAILFAAVAFALFAVGFVGLSILASFDFVKKLLEKHRRLALLVGASIVYVIAIKATIVWFG